MASHFAAGPDAAEAEAPKRRRRGIVSLAVALALLVVGAFLLLAPTVSAVMGQLDAEGTVSNLRHELTVMDPEAHSDDDASDGYLSKEGDPTYEALTEYSEEVREGTGDKVNDPFALSGADLNEMGLPDGLVGTIEVPALGVTLPLYLGATYENMSWGAAVVAGTSMPVGGESSNCVIAAHRGVWRGVQMFRDIEQMQIGDTVTIETPWDSLTYRAVEIRVVEPDDVESLAVREGKDMVTLLTCHPYLVSSHRYLVYCERVPDEDAQPAPGVAERVTSALLPAVSEGSPALTAELALRVAGLVLVPIVAVALVVAIVRRARGGAERKSPPPGTS